MQVEEEFSGCGKYPAGTKNDFAKAWPYQSNEPKP